MPRIGYHASHEQFSPGDLLGLVRLAEEAGFAEAKSSDHFHPWSARQGQSGFAWSWLGAAMQATALPFGLITAPGWRYHPALVAQGAATLAEMFPGRFWLALGSGEAINEAILGEYWPDKPERNARLRECAAVIRALFDGETVTHRGRVTVVEARLYTLPADPVPLYGAAVSPETAREVAGWADGLLTTGGRPEDVSRVVEAFRDGGGEGKPVHIQHSLSWAAEESEALALAMDQWAPVVAGGEANWDLRRPADFDRIGGLVSEPAMRACVAISADPGWHRDRIAALCALGDVVHLHCVGRNQRAFIETFGEKVLPALG
ncbi:TIGR03885 family FMN-dependent LLM class oxidoreductase [Rhodobacter sp. SGA-6-6]|uniref:TIGR03885 family FMN-dependent LLM class oxidoreductase n=1 Tax=Rhodobacter sp. SGA-6-6 TaxID=2710882 RepID=UPI0013EDCFF4|nr:TIGR03885 family FMN-dependent LLM class oxidoreductase [Rhodobacter sp. SGA-6-6]NGM46142.1 TIGR03885 family FMN-dependent LLM class oxidoreductase [Rhodobacter sp. SGA-6-6]